MPTVEVESGDHIAIVYLNRPERLNAIDRQMADELLAALNCLRDNLDCRVVILTGRGRGFSAGLDLQEDPRRATDPPGEPQARYRVVQRMATIASTLRAIPQPVIAAVNGPAAGGGMGIALACDVRVASESAVFLPSFATIGLSAGEMGTSFFLPRIVGSEHAARVLYTAARVSAQEAKELGLVSRVVQDGEALAEARKLAGDMVRSVSPLGLRLTKELLNVSAGATSLEMVLHLENRGQALAVLTEDHREAVRAFRKRRPPMYRDA